MSQLLVTNYNNIIYHLMLYNIVYSVWWTNRGQKCFCPRPIIKQ